MPSSALNRILALPCALIALGGVAEAASAYVNPFPGADAYVGRTDMGVDVCLKPGDPILALGDGVVTGIMKDWYAGQPYIWYRLSSGPQAGRYVYVSEQIAGLAKVGTPLRAGDVIGRYARKGTCLETGWSEADGRTTAAATTGYTEGQATVAGVSFARFLISLGLTGNFGLTPTHPQAVRRKPRPPAPKPVPSLPEPVAPILPSGPPARPPVTAPAPSPVAPPAVPAPSGGGSYVPVPASGGGTVTVTVPVTAGAGGTLTIPVTRGTTATTTSSPATGATSRGGLPWWNPTDGYGATDGSGHPWQR